MQRELLIFRHGKSDWRTDADDFNRPLKDRGKRSAQRMGVHLWKSELRPDHIVSSPAERARTTAEKCCKAMGLTGKDIHRDSRIYEAELDNLLKVLAECPQDARRVMIVGHNPGLEMLLLHLSADEIARPDDDKILPTATLARLIMPDNWDDPGKACAKLVSITRPGDLPDKFPFPAPDGEEQRDRPAYYYSQSSVIPYRLRNGEPEILVILSSKRKHFVVPKGIHDPGLTAQQSAAKEAFEEAGVEGNVDETAIGSYRYDKWGAPCTVLVYPMKVVHEIPLQEWEESHRGRQWVTPEVAAERLKQAALAPMVLKLAHQLKTRT